MKSFGTTCGAFAVLGLLCGAASAFAQSNPSQMSEVQGATTGLGSSHRFATQGAAMDHCPGDTIVWASRNKLTYVMPGAAGYGSAGSGFYACKAEADDAGFQPGS
jgi:hypothetical protein